MTQGNRSAEDDVPAYRDPTHEGNSSRYHTGELCIEQGCSRPAGTLWSLLWCFEHNIQRMDRISANLEKIAKEWQA